MTLEMTSNQFDHNVGSYDQIIVSTQMLLMKLGLTQNESKVYLYLNKNGSKRAIDISKDQKITRTQIYPLLAVLKNKGIVTIRSDRVRTFDVVGLDEAFDILTNAAQTKINNTKLMRKELKESWKMNFYK